MAVWCVYYMHYQLKPWSHSTFNPGPSPTVHPHRTYLNKEIAEVELTHEPCPREYPQWFRYE
jgi:hypothetical protein